MTADMADYLTGAEFQVLFDLISVSFAKVTNIKAQVEYDTFIEGGVNDVPHYFVKPKKHADTIIFEKGLNTKLTNNIFSTISEGMKIKNIIILVKNRGTIERIFTIDEGIVLSKEFSGFDAMSRNVLVERLELAHSGLKETFLPF